MLQNNNSKILKIKQKIQKWLELGLYFIPEAQNLHAELFFNFKAVRADSSIDFRRETIKNHQKTMSTWVDFWGSTPPMYIPLQQAPMWSYAKDAPLC